MTSVALSETLHHSLSSPIRSLNSIFPNPHHWIDDEATVEKKIEAGKRGRVNYHGTSWLAKSLKNKTLTVNSEVKVIGRKNLTLLVEDRG